MKIFYEHGITQKREWYTSITEFFPNLEMLIINPFMQQLWPCIEREIPFNIQILGFLVSAVLSSQEHPKRTYECILISQQPSITGSLQLFIFCIQNRCIAIRACTYSCPGINHMRCQPVPSSLFMCIHDAWFSVWEPTECYILRTRYIYRCAYIKCTFVSTYGYVHTGASSIQFHF